MNKSVFILFLLVLLNACGSSKNAVSNEKTEEDIVVNTNTELAIAGASNFDSDEDLNIKTAILKNVLADKSGAYIGHQMDKLALYLKDRIEYNELLRAGEGLILELNNTKTFYFDTGKTGLNPTSKETLNVVINSLKVNPKINAVIEIHTDGKGANNVNLVMTEKRGKSIYDYFVSQGIDADRLNLLALGENFPQNENSSTQELNNNRRVAFGFYASEALKEEARMMTK